MTTANIVIDPEFKALIPPLDPEELSMLEQSLQAEGVRDALVTWNNILVDGHHRYEICSRLGIKFKTINKDFDDRPAARVWIRNNQLARRNLSPAWRIELVYFNKSDLSEIGKQKQSAAGGDRKTPGSKIASINIDGSARAPDTQKQMAAAAGVSTGSFAAAEVVIKNEPDLWKKALDGELTIGGAYKATKRKMKERSHEQRREKNKQTVRAAPDTSTLTGCFSTILIDPPWDWGDEGDINQLGRAKPTYSTMPLDELAKLPVGKLADVDAHLYLWITNRSLPKGFHLIEQWGFRYVTCLTWCKPSFGMGNYFRGSTEHILFAIKGSLNLKRKDAGTWFAAPRGPKGHSSKPSELYDLVESCSPGPYLEMFARSKRNQWTSWGGELQ